MVRTPCQPRAPTRAPGIQLHHEPSAGPEHPESVRQQSVHFPHTIGPADQRVPGLPRRHRRVERLPLGVGEIWRVRHQQVQRRARQRRREVPPHQAHSRRADFTPVDADDRECAERPVERNHLGVRALRRQAECEAAAAGTHVRNAAGRRDGERQLDELLRLRPRDQDTSVHPEGQMTEPGLTRNIGERLTTRPALDGRQESGCRLAVELTPDAQCLPPRLGDAAAAKRLGRLGEQRSRGQHLSHPVPPGSPCGPLRPADRSPRSAHRPGCTPRAAAGGP